MIYLNSQKYTLTKDDIKEFLTANPTVDVEGKPKGQLKLNIQKQYIQKVTIMSDRDGREKPNGAIIQPQRGQKMDFNSIDEKGNMVHWQWAPREQTYDKAVQQYKAESGIVNLTGGTIFNIPKDLEVVWFLWKFCPMIENGLTKSRSIKAIFSFENKKLEAKTKVLEEKQITEIKSAIFALNETELQRVYAAVYEAVADPSLSVEEIQAALINSTSIAARREKMFAALKGGATEISAMVKTAIELGVITGNDERTVISVNGKDTPIAAIPFEDSDAFERIVTYLDNNRNLYNKVKKQVEALSIAQ
jgi:hypothetical protein